MPVFIDQVLELILYILI